MFAHQAVAVGAEHACSRVRAAVDDIHCAASVPVGSAKIVDNDTVQVLCVHDFDQSSRPSRVTLHTCFATGIIFVVGQREGDGFRYCLTARLVEPLRDELVLRLYLEHEHVARNPIIVQCWLALDDLAVSEAHRIGFVLAQ